MAGHFFGLGEVHELEDGGCDIGEFAGGGEVEIFAIMAVDD